MASERPQAVAIACPAGRGGAGRTAYLRLSYRELDERSARIARGLESYGIGRGVRTVLMVRPGIDLFCLVFGMFRAGAVPVLVDPGIGRRHLKRCIDTAEPEAFIGVPAASALQRQSEVGQTIRRRVTVGAACRGSARPSRRSRGSVGGVNPVTRSPPPPMNLQPSSSRRARPGHRRASSTATPTSWPRSRRSASCSTCGRVKSTCQPFPFSPSSTPRSA
jgi:acyl-CoA synthetase (AMP-forming)/AMP-acid ligase II